MSTVTAIAFETLLKQLEQETSSPAGGTDTVPLADAFGRILARDIEAITDMPPFTNSAMDGYAWRSTDFAGAAGEQTLPVAATVTAGHPVREPLPQGCAIRIMTGAPLPEGFDVVLPIEKAVLREEKLVTDVSAYRPGMNVRRLGELYTKGSPLLKAGTRLGTDAIGLLASNGCGDVPCHRLRVALFASGDELIEPQAGVMPDPSKIYNANGVVMTLLARETGAQADYLGILPDAPEAIEEQLSAALPHYDVIVCSGGVGPGDRDYTARILEKFGTMHHYHVAMKPGKPFTYARLEGAHPVFFLGLPGNPVATNTTGRFFLQKVLCRLMGTEPNRPVMRAVLDTPVLRSKAGRTDFIRGTASPDGEGRWHVVAHPMQSSASLFGCAHSNAIIELGDEVTEVRQGETVRIHWLG